MSYLLSSRSQDAIHNRSYIETNGSMCSVKVMQRLRAVLEPAPEPEKIFVFKDADGNPSAYSLPAETARSLLAAMTPAVIAYGEVTLRIHKPKIAVTTDARKLLTSFELTLKVPSATVPPVTEP